MAAEYAAQAEELKALLGLGVEPLAISFVTEASANAPRFGGTRPAPTPDGRTGAVPAGCVFWMKAVDREFATDAADHGNCSVGALTHGFKSVAEAAAGADVAALVAAEWVPPDILPLIPTLKQKPDFVVYGPLKSAARADVVFLRLNGKQLMLLHEAVPELRFEGKPQCHIIPLAKEMGAIAVSTGCMLSRVRTGMGNNEVTCAFPAPRLADVIARLRKAQPADLRVAAYAGEDAKRFSAA